MPRNEYDDSNAAARPCSVPTACVTHLRTPLRFLPAWRGLLLPGPIPGVAKVHHRSLSRPSDSVPTQRCVGVSPTSVPGGWVGRTTSARSSYAKVLRGEGWDGGAPCPTSMIKECNEMQPNATELKVSPLLATPNEATVATSRATLAQCVGVSECQMRPRWPHFQPRR